MKCSRCSRLIEGSGIRFAEEGDWMGKPLCRKCKAEVVEESRNRYREGRCKGNGYSKRDQYATSVYEQEG
jgi:DNA-directed RNA polymerase subunit RPC12/RpoP